nr:MAG TPA: hypothetical protein [Caudoviricetes sp.]
MSIEKRIFLHRLKIFIQYSIIFTERRADNHLAFNVNRKKNFFTQIENFYPI